MDPARTTPKAAKGDAPSDTNPKKKGTGDNKIKRKNPLLLSERDNAKNGGGDDDDDGLIIEIPRKISTGNTLSPNQHLLIFVGFLAFLLHAASKMGTMVGPGQGSGKHHRVITSPIHRWKERQKYLQSSIMDPLIKIILAKNPDAFSGNEYEDDPCGIYLAPSSLPESGWGWFAGKNYTIGESIREERGNAPPVPPPIVSESATPSYKGIAPWSMLLNPHSVLSNVRWEEVSSSSLPQSPLPDQRRIVSSVLVATRDILEGEEFFLSWEDHPYGPPPSLDDSSDDSSVSAFGVFDYVFSNSLTFPEHFARADKRIREARIQYFGAINYTQLAIDNTKPKEQRKPTRYGTSNARWNRVRQKYNKMPRPSGLLYRPESTKDIETGLKLWKQAIETYDPMVARLLPTKVRTLAMYHERAVKDESLFSSSSLLVSLQNQTVRSLAKTATCVSSLEWQLVAHTPTTGEADSEDEPGIEAQKQTTESPQTQESCAASKSSHHQVVTRKRGFSKGETIGVVPLLVLEQAQALSMTSTGTYLPIGSSSSTKLKLTICPVGGIYESTRDLRLANAEYRWSSSMTNDIPAGIKSLIGNPAPTSPLSTQEEQQQKAILLKEYPLSMSWDIVTLRDLQQNETVVLYQPDDSVAFVNSRQEIESDIEEESE